MAEPYYTDSMRQFVADLPNTHDFQVEISQYQDNDGDFLVLTFTHDSFEYWSQDDAFTDITQYLIDLRNGLIERGARATFNVVGAWDEKE